MSLFEELPKPKILLVNFSSKQVSRFRDAGYNVEISYIGGLSMRFTGHTGLYGAEYYTMPRPPYEYDIFITQTDMPQEGQKHKLSDSDVYKCNEDVKSLVERLRVQSLSICFLGNELNLTTPIIAGIPEIELQNADSRDSSLEVDTRNRTFKISEIDELLSNHKNSIAKVSKYITEGDMITSLGNVYRIPVFRNRAGQIVAEYGSEYMGDEGSILKYVLLPEFNDNVKVALSILAKQRELGSELFSESGTDWRTSSDFTFDEVKEIEKDIAGKEKGLRKYKEKKEAEIEKINKELVFIKQILIADDEHFEGDDRLTPNIAKVLRFLGFEVKITENIAVKGKQREDLFISDSDKFRALVEVKGTGRKNPPEGYFGQLLNQLRKANDLSLNGVLVVNYDYNTHPFERVKIYKDSEDLFSDDSDGLGVLSTVDLFRIIMDVKKGLLSKEDAREIIKKPNRIEYPTKKSKS